MDSPWLTDEVMFVIAALVLVILTVTTIIFWRYSSKESLRMLAPLFSQILFTYYYWELSRQGLNIDVQIPFLQTITRPALVILWVHNVVHVVIELYRLRLVRELERQHFQQVGPR